LFTTHLIDIILPTEVEEEILKSEEAKNGQETGVNQ